MSKWNIAAKSKDEQDKVNVDWQRPASPTKSA